jgi:hypothetical protein
MHVEQFAPISVVAQHVDRSSSIIRFYELYFFSFCGDYHVIFGAFSVGREGARYVLARSNQRINRMVQK